MRIPREHKQPRWLIVLDGARMTTLPLSGAKAVVVIPDPIRNRMFVVAGPSLIEYALPSLERVGDLPLGRSLGWFNFDRFFASDDGSRIVWMADENKVRVLNTRDRTSYPEAKTGTSGAKAKKALGDVLRQAGEAVLRHSLGGESVMIKTAFRSDSQQAYALASTGELATIDLGTGRVLAHRPGGNRLVSTASLIFTVGPTLVNVIDRSTGADVQLISQEKTAPGWPVLAFSSDGTRAIVTGGTSVHFLDGRTGKTVARASGLGHIVAARFLE